MEDMQTASPGKLELGVTYQEEENYTLGFDVSFQEWSDYNNFNASNLNNSL